MIFIIILFLILFIYIFIIDYNKFKNKELFSDSYLNQNNINFLNIKDSLFILKNDDDNYFKSFYKLDYISRKISCIEDYYLSIDKSVDQFTNNEKNKIIKCTQYADNKLRKIYFDWFNGNKCSKIKWNMICIKGKLYENGLPHTRSNFIIISKDDVNNFSINKLTKTLIHEKVHIYQKIYKEDTEKYLNEYKFKKYKYREENSNIRANPDIDKWIYKDEFNNIYCAKYINNKPESIESIEYEPYNSQSYEHPFEKMAIYIENYIN
jgi:hypothetical protein